MSDSSAPSADRDSFPGSPPFNDSLSLSARAKLAFLLPIVVGTAGYAFFAHAYQGIQPLMVAFMVVVAMTAYALCCFGIGMLIPPKAAEAKHCAETVGSLALYVGLVHVNACGLLALFQWMRSARQGVMGGWPSTTDAVVVLVMMAVIVSFCVPFSRKTFRFSAPLTIILMGCSALVIAGCMTVPTPWSVLFGLISWFAAIVALVDDKR